jgi:hypothetical protein
MEKSNIQKSIMQANVNAMNRVATKRERERLEKPQPQRGLAICRY